MSAAVIESVSRVGGDDLLGRPTLVVATGELSETARVDDLGRVMTMADPYQWLGQDELVVLPRLGEPVRTVDDCGRTVLGCWLGLAGSATGQTVPAFLLDEGQVRRVMLPVREIDARRSVSGAAAEDARTVLAALLAEAGAHAATSQRHQAWVDDLVAGAHAEAEARGWCGEFDEFMEDRGLPRRCRDYDLTVHVTATVHLTGRGTDLDDAADEVTTSDVWGSLSRDDIEFTVSR